MLGGMLCFALSAANAQTEVSKYIPGVTTDGVTYFLPKTGLKVRVTARKITHTPGEFVEYAERYIHSKESADSYTNWSIENIDVAAFNVTENNIVKTTVKNGTIKSIAVNIDGKTKKIPKKMFSQNGNTVSFSGNFAGNVTIK